MADLISKSNLGSTESTMFHMDSPIETEQTSGKNASSSNGYSISRGDGAGDAEDSPIFETTLSRGKNMDFVSITPSITRLHRLSHRTTCLPNGWTTAKGSVYTCFDFI